MAKHGVPRTNRRAALVVATFAVLALAWAPRPTAATAAGCANEAIRAEQGPAGQGLPDCRAYELVSPGSTPLVGSAELPGLPAPVNFGARAADDGNAMAYFSYYPFASSPSAGFLYRTRRGATGWSPEAMSPQLLPGAVTKVTCEATELNYSENLATSLLKIGRDSKQESPQSSFCGQPQEPVLPGEPRGFANLLRRAAPGAPYELVNAPPPGVSPANAQFQDASDDLSHIAFGEEAALTPEAPPGYNLYLWAGGMVRLVSFLPDGTPVRGDLAGATSHTTAGLESGGSFAGTAPITNAVSADGERVFFYAGGNLYVRENAGQPPTAAGPCSEEERERACTLQVDASRGPGNSGGGVFQYAGADGGRVFFTAESRLTNSSSAAAGEPDLYEYQVEPRVIADRTPGGSEAADVRGFSGAAESGARLYFVARGALTGTQGNALGEVAQAGQPNLYLLEAGALTFIATLDPVADRSAWSSELSSVGGEAPTGPESFLATRTSPDGRFFAFNSVRGLTGGPAGTGQIFLYDAVSHTLACASCLPGGSPPVGPAAIPSPIKTTEAEAPIYLPRGLTDSGQLFFTTTQTLLPSDSDGVADVYEYRQGGLSLISAGAGAGPSFFFDASVGGGDVFFATSDPLVRSDTDNALSLYDARVGGGFAEPPTPEPPCSAAGSCRNGGSGAPSTGTAATTTHTGPGNVARAKRCKRGKVKRHGRCVVKKKHRKHKKHRSRKRGSRR